MMICDSHSKAKEVIIQGINPVLIEGKQAQKPIKKTKNIFDSDAVAGHNAVKRLLGYRKDYETAFYGIVTRVRSDIP